jgi:hypothetical protein
MAFGTANVKSISLGGALKLTVGDWSGVAGDAPGTLGIGAGKVYQAQFLANLTSGPAPIDVLVSPSGTAGIVTLTVYNQATVTAGQFSIISA